MCTDVCAQLTDVAFVLCHCHSTPLPAASIAHSTAPAHCSPLPHLVHKPCSQPPPVPPFPAATAHIPFPDGHGDQVSKGCSLYSTLRPILTVALGTLALTLVLASARRAAPAGVCTNYKKRRHCDHQGGGGGGCDGVKALLGTGGEGHEGCSGTVQYNRRPVPCLWGDLLLCRGQFWGSGGGDESPVASTLGDDTAGAIVASLGFWPTHPPTYQGWI